MASEAQRLIGISLAKIAQSRVGRSGVSLHKNLLVATVLQKARYIFMGEAYHMVHGHYPQHCRQFVISQQQQQQQPPPPNNLHIQNYVGESNQHHQKSSSSPLTHLQQQQQNQQQEQQNNVNFNLYQQYHHLNHIESSSTDNENYDDIDDEDEDDLEDEDEDEIDEEDINENINNTVNEILNETNILLHNQHIIYPQTSPAQSVIVKNDQQKYHIYDKENNPPEHNNTNLLFTTTSDSNEQLTYLDLDKNKLQRINQPDDHESDITTSIDISLTNNSTILMGMECIGNKRRRISDNEIEEAVLSILPKRQRHINDIIESDICLDHHLSNNYHDTILSVTESILSSTDQLIETTSSLSSLSSSLSSSSSSVTAAALISECISVANDNFHHISSYGEDALSNNNDSLTTNSILSAAVNESSPMEIDRITSLVSIFSFGNLNRSTPDLCSSQAKDSDNLSQRGFIAMTV